MTDFALRPWEEADAASLARWADDPGIAAHLRDVFPSPYMESDAAWFIRDCMAREGRDQMCRAVVVDGVAVGCVTVTRGATCTGRAPSWVTGWAGTSGAGGS